MENINGKLFDLYGHTISESEILSLYPCDQGDFDRKNYENSAYTITYDVHTAYNLRLQNLPVVTWGQRYKEGRKAFVFKMKRPDNKLF